jgi:asparagine synthase (glutamine-hydrolysing)
MCGICGELRLDGGVAAAGELTAMRDRLAHRGPDAAGTFVSDDRHSGLAFRRLRIIDLSANGDQPMPNEDGSVRVVFNGEIYNFKELRRRLEARGHRFRSHSDTETIVHLYEESGADCVRELDGMFAIAIWDERKRRLLLTRDRAGKKPLFYYHDGHRFAFASEIKAFFGHPDIPIAIDPEAVPQYLRHGYVPGPRTFYRQVFQVPPGTTISVDEDGTIDAQRYWHLEFPREGEVPSITIDAAADGVRSRLTAAVARRLISDVPLGAFLSGGIDSTIIVGLMSAIVQGPVRTFSIGFEGEAAYDETAYARIAAERFKTEHTEFHVRPSAFELIDPLIWHHDGPFGDSSAVPTFIVSKLTREKVTVVLTGDGGDELFAGYMRFYAALASERFPRWLAGPARALAGALPTPADDRHWIARGQRFARPLGRPIEERIAAWHSIFFDELPALLRPDFAASLPAADPLQHVSAERPLLEGRSALSRLLHANFTSYLADDLLVKTDRCTMANSLEARSPFLDRELIEYAARLPDDFKLRGRQTKVILRRAFADLLPPAIARRGKMGFGVPVGSWFRGELRGCVRETLLPAGAKYRQMLDGTFVERLVARHLAGQVNAGPQLWSLVCFERWLQLLPAWIGSPVAKA